MTETPKLTPAQQRYLDEIREAGEKTYNGRAAQVIRALEAADLVEATWDAQMRSKGNGVYLAQSITVRPR